jgi:hypothetical protein
MEDTFNPNELLKQARDAFHAADQTEYHGDVVETVRLLATAANMYSKLDTWISTGGEKPDEWK